MQVWKATCDPQAFLVPWPQSRFRSTFNAALSSLELQTYECGPCSLRRGGATDLWMSCRNYSQVAHTGRCSAERTVKGKNQDSIALLTQLTFKPFQKHITFLCHWEEVTKSCVEPQLKSTKRGRGRWKECYECCLLISWIQPCWPKEKGFSMWLCFASAMLALKEKAFWYGYFWSKETSGRGRSVFYSYQLCSCFSTKGAKLHFLELGYSSDHIASHSIYVYMYICIYTYIYILYIYHITICMAYYQYIWHMHIASFSIRIMFLTQPEVCGPDPCPALGARSQARLDQKTTCQTARWSAVKSTIDKYFRIGVYLAYFSAVCLVNLGFAMQSAVVSRARSAELSGENDKLRRELERTTKILEVPGTVHRAPCNTVSCEDLWRFLKANQKINDMINMWSDSIAFIIIIYVFTYFHMCWPTQALVFQLIGVRCWSNRNIRPKTRWWPWSRTPWLWILCAKFTW